MRLIRKLFMLIMLLSGVCNLLRAQWDQQDIPAPVKDNGIANDQLVLSSIPEMDMETRKNLLYLYARLNKPKVAEALAQTVWQEIPSDRETLLVMGSMYLERKDATKTLQIGKRVLKYYPEDDQGWYFVASAFELMNQYREAESIFRKLREKQFKYKPFPYDIDLGNAASNAGNWNEAMRAYQRILSDGKSSPVLKQQARLVLDEIYRKNLPQMKIKSDWIGLDTGTIWKNTFDYDFAVNEKNRLYLSVINDNIRQEDTEFTLTGQRSFVEGLVKVRTFWPSQWYSEIGVGGFDGGCIASGSMWYQFEPECKAGLSLEYHARAQDSLLLELIDGRQSRVSVPVEWLLLPDTRFSGDIFARSVEAQNEFVGNGYGINVNVQQILLKNPFQLALTYIGQYERFNNADNPAINTLTSPYLKVPLGSLPSNSNVQLINELINRQDMMLSMKGDITKQFKYDTGVMAGYVFSEVSPDYGFYLEFSYYFTKSIMFSIRGGYDSWGSQSSDSASTYVNTSLFVWF